MIEGAAVNYFYFVAERKIRRGAKKSCDVVAGGETTFSEEFSSGSAGAEDGDVHGGSF